MQIRYISARNSGSLGRDPVWGGSWKNGTSKIDESLLTQPHIAPLFWKLVGWCITDIVIILEND